VEEIVPEFKQAPPPQPPINPSFQSNNMMPDHSAPSSVSGGSSETLIQTQAQNLNFLQQQFNQN
jgi:hypothetical protein